MNEEKEEKEEYGAEALLDHCALECMRAMENKDKEAFRSAFQVLVYDILAKLSDSTEKE